MFCTAGGFSKDWHRFPASEVSPSTTLPGGVHLACANGDRGAGPESVFRVQGNAGSTLGPDQRRRIQPVANTGWTRHPKKDGQRVLDEFAKAGWRIDNPPKYYRVRCPCGSHLRYIHLTPSNPQYWTEALAWLHRQPCYPEQLRDRRRR